MDDLSIPDLKLPDVGKDSYPSLPDVKLPSLDTFDVKTPKPYNPPAIKPLSQVTEDVPQAQDPSFTGFFKNLGDNFVDVSKGLGQMIYWLPDKLVKTGSEWVKYIQGNRDSILNDYSPESLDVIKQGIHENIKDIIKATVESYKGYSNPLQKIYDRPLDVFMDVLTVADLGTTAYGNFAGVAAKSAAKLGNVAEAAKWTSLAKNAEKGAIGQFLDPIAKSQVLNVARKVPIIDKTLQAMHLTPESRTTATLWNEIINKIQATGRDRDIRDLAVAIQSIPEADRVENIFKVAMGELPDNAITHPASRQAMELIKKMVHDQTLGKIERGALTESQAENARWVPLRHALTKVELGKLKNTGVIGDDSLQAFNFLLSQTKKGLSTKLAIKKLAESGDLGKVLNLDEMQKIARDKQPNRVLLDKFAPMRDKLELKLRPDKASAEPLIKKAKLYRNRLDALKKLADAHEAAIDAAVEHRNNLYQTIMESIDWEGPQHPGLRASWEREMSSHGAVPREDGFGFSSSRSIDNVLDKPVPLSPELTEEQKIFARRAQSEVRHAAKDVEVKRARFEEIYKKLEPADNMFQSAVDDLRKHRRSAGYLQQELNVKQPGIKTIAEQRGLEPFYLPLIHANHLDVANAFLPREMRQIKASWMKRRTGAEGAITDVGLIAPIMRQQYRQFEAIHEFFRRFKSQPFVKDVSKDVLAGTYKTTPGTVLFSDEAMRTFYKDLFKTQEKFAQNIKDIVGQSGEITNDAFKRAMVNTLTPDLEAMLQTSVKGLGNARLYEIPRDVSQLLTKQVSQISPLARFIFDAPMDLLRVSALYMNPMWYIHNLFGNIILNFMGGVSPLSYLRAGAKNFRKIVPEELRSTIESVLNTSFTQAERAKRGLTSLPPFRSLGKINEAIEDWARSAHFMDQITKEAVKRRLLTSAERMFASNEFIATKLKPLFEEAAQRGARVPEVVLGLKEASAVRDAIGHVNRWLFDYSNLHPVERNIIRRIVPFWTWMKNTNLLIAKLPASNPLMARVFSQAGEIHRDALAHVAVDSIDEEHLPDWLEGHMPVGTDSQGNFVFVSLRALNPFNGFGRLFDPKKMVSVTNPVIKATVEYLGGRDMWSKKDLQNNEPVFDYTGRVYKIRVEEDGRTHLVRDVPGEGWVQQFASQFTQVKLARSLYNYYVRDPRFMKEGEPSTHPFMDEYGNWQYPTEILDTALRFAGIQMKRVNQDDLRTKAAFQKKAFVESMKKNLKEAPPEYRDYVIDAIRHMGSGLVEDR